jgi:replicative DNA helicase
MADDRNSNRKKILRVPPQSKDAELAVLGSILLRPESIYEIMDTVRPHCFYFDRNRIVFETMLELNHKHIPIDIISLSERLKEKSLLEQIGGSSYLTELTDLIPSASNIRHYASTIQKKFLMRELIKASEDITQLGYNEKADIEETLDSAEKKIFAISQIGATSSFTDIKDTLPEAWERIDTLHNSKDEMRGIPTGFKGLDDLLAGFQKSDLIILAARPSMGKTSLALDIARKTAITNNVPVGIFSLEMSSQQLVDRMLSAQSNVDAWKLRTGNLSQETDFEAIRQSLDDLSTAPIFIDDQPGNNILRMRSTARRLKSEKGLGLIIVDYLQLMVPTNTKASDSMVQQVTEISRSLKNLARELEVPVLALSQLSRAVEQRGGKPRLSDLRDSGSIEQDADVVMFIHREDKYNKESDRPNIAEIMIEKHRNGPTGSVDLYFNEKKTSFQDVEKTNFSTTSDGFADF